MFYKPQELMMGDTWQLSDGNGGVNVIFNINYGYKTQDVN